MYKTKYNVSVAPSRCLGIVMLVLLHCNRWFPGDDKVACMIHLCFFRGFESVFMQTLRGLSSAPMHPPKSAVDFGGEELKFTSKPVSGKHLD